MPPWWAAIANYRTLRAEVDTPHKAAVAYRYFVLEITSKWTRREDEGRKKKLYEDLGVREYWQFDPTGHYLEPILKGRELGPEGKYRDLELKERDGALCHASLLGLELRLEGRRLVYFDPLRNASLTDAHRRTQRQASGASGEAEGRGGQAGMEMLLALTKHNKLLYLPRACDQSTANP